MRLRRLLTVQAMGALSIAPVAIGPVAVSPGLLVLGASVHAQAAPAARQAGSGPAKGHAQHASTGFDGVLVAGVGAGLGTVGWLLLLAGSRRVRRRAEPGREFWAVERGPREVTATTQPVGRHRLAWAREPPRTTDPPAPGGR
jgi:hypothetical protein